MDRLVLSGPNGEDVGIRRAIALGEVWERVHLLWPRIKLQASSSEGADVEGIDYEELFGQ